MSNSVAFRLNAKTALDDAGETIVNTTLVDAGNDSDYDSGT